jgi:hypothetical protein
MRLLLFVIEPSLNKRAGAFLLYLPYQRPHPTFVETTLPQRGRLVKAPAFVWMYAEFSSGLDDYNLILAPWSGTLAGQRHWGRGEKQKISGRL